jgi:hypothetical protein
MYIILPAICQDLPNVRNGELLIKRSHQNGKKTVEMKCLSGFRRLTGSDTWECDRGKWVINQPGDRELRCEKGKRVIDFEM